MFLYGYRIILLQLYRTLDCCSFHQLYLLQPFNVQLAITIFKQSHIKLIFFLDVSDHCSKKKCQTFAMCHVEGDKAECKCPKCEAIYVPVCGSDGLTHASNCYLKQAACQLSRNIYFGKEGACGMHLF